MKRSSILVGLLIFCLALSACSSAVATGGTTQPANSAQNAGPDGALSPEMQLAVGTLLLEDSEQPINAETAAELLPLWKAVRSLGSSSTITTQEYQALFDQIKETLTSEQMDAITAMELTREDLMSLSDKLGITMMGGGGGPMGTPSAEMLETLQAARESGQMPEMPAGGIPGGGSGGMPAGGGFQGGGGIPGGGMGPGMAGGMAGMPTEEASTDSVRARSGVTQSIPTELLDAVIDYLQTMIEG